MEKTGELTTKSASDYRDEKGQVKKAAYYDEEGVGVADVAHKDKLKKPQKL